MTNSGENSIFAKAATGVFIAKVFGSGLSLVSQIMIARLLGSASFGVYTYAIACSYLLLLVVTMGLDQGARRFVASYHARGEAGMLRGFVSFSHRAVFTASVSVAAAAFVILWLGSTLGDELAATVLVACLLVPTAALAQLSASCLEGFQRVVLSRTVVEVARPLLLVLGLGCAYFVANAEASASHIMGVNLLAYACAAALLGLFLARVMREAVPTAGRQYQKREWRRVSWQLAVIGGLHLLLAQTDVLMIGLLTDTTEAGVYSVASKVATLALFGLIAGNAIVAPMISDLFSQGKMDRLQEIISLAAKGTSVVTLLLSVGIIVFKTTILGAFGEDFAEAETALLILLAGQAVNALVGPVAFIMTMTSHQGLAGKVIGLSALLNIALNMVFIPMWGIEGAALATAVSTASWNVALAVMTWRRLGLRSSFF